jgi:hypothetical protein
MIYPLQIPAEQAETIGNAILSGWDLLGWVEHENTWRMQEAVMKNAEEFMRIMPNGKIRHNRYNWRTDQDRTIIYKEVMSDPFVKSKDENNYLNYNHRKLMQRTSKLYRKQHNIA